ncbi:MAG: beta-ketoacyl synthase N-terminal-like domain-containing protein [Acidobacteriota bacterium]|nr:beta-ketoacyl synthase N-terminal-like domain-containing protein [Acidobacteriota bacterium]
MTTHLGAVNRLLWMRETFALGRTDRVLQKTPFTYDISVWEFFLPLISGATVVMAGPDGHRDPAYLVDLMARRQVSLTHFTPSMLQACLDTNNMDNCLALRRVLCSEEALPRTLQERFYKHCPDAELHNLYGPPEIAIDVSFWAENSTSHWQSVPIGKPISNVQVYVLDQSLKPLPIGVEGELYVGGESLARGFLDDPRLTAELLIPDPFGKNKGARIYKTGDLVRYLPDGFLEFLGHMDHQQKVAGSRIEYGEVKAVLETVPGVRDALAMTRDDVDGLVAYYIPAEDQEPDVEEMRNQVKKILPNYMCPDAFVRLDAFPITPNGRINRRALPQPKKEPGERESTYARAYSQVERSILRVWQEVLGLERIGLRDDFFELGGDSLKLMQVYDKLPDILKGELSRIDLFKHRNIHDLAFYMEEEEDPDAMVSLGRENKARRKALLDDIAGRPGLKIAVVGMSLRVPGASDEESFWQMLRDGECSVRTFSREELEAFGVDPEEMDDPNYVPVRATLDDVRGFDHTFFGMTPREAQLTDPQQRLMMECAWEALENAGYHPHKYKEPIGLFAGSGQNYYLEEHLLANRDLVDTVGLFSIMISNTKDNMTPRIAYRLNLTGPTVAVQSACSTALVSVHMAAQALRAGDCGIALAGGVSLGYHTKLGFVYEEGMLQPPDGHTRSFDAQANGSIPGQGAGVVVLKRLEDAVEDGDRIYAVLNGSAVNNDGADKENYASYGVEGQRRVVRHAMKVAGVTAEDISFVETSSTASKLGDPIELEALTRAYRQDTDKKGYCAVGAVKPNIGNLDSAAGAIALIKAVLAVNHGELPPNINFEKPNPDIDFVNSPFVVNTRLKPWKPEGGIRRAGVSAFGLGGNNAHLILEQGPEIKQVTPSRPWQLITLSAKTPGALDTKTDELVRYMAANPHTNFSEVAYTLHVGRRDFKYRRMLTCQNLHEAVLEFERKESRRVYTKAVKTTDRSIAFMFPGQGAQYLNMGRELYRKERLYRQEVERCWEIIREHVPELFKNLTRQDRGGRTEKLNRTYVAQPALFITEYALAKLLMHWGVQPQVMIGNSLGEYVAACLSGVFSLLDALDAVVTRGRLMQSMPPGAQLMVNLPESQVQSLLHEQLSLAAVVGPNQCVLAGDKEAIGKIRQKLVNDGVDCRRMHTSHAFHSYMMDPILPEFTERLKLFKLNPPKIPFISNLTGTWITDEQATDPHYWARHLREPVRFYQGIQEIYNTPDRIILEVGPEKTLSPIAIAHRPKDGDHQVLATMPQPHEEESDMHFLLNTAGRLWLAGMPVDWDGFHDGYRRRRLALPTYPFERSPAWIEPVKKAKPDDEYWLQPDEFDDIVDDSELDAHYRPNVSTDFVAPRNRDEEIIAEAWREYLGMAELGIHDDFFELGGTSLIAVRLTGKLGRLFNVPMASHTLIQKRTIAMLSEYIAEHRSTGGKGVSDSPIVEIQRGNARVMPLVMVHPVGGEVYYYKDLALNLGARQPLYGIQAPSLVGNREPFDNIPKQAAYYIEELLKFQPKPPYILGGSSYGGVIAYEMSQQLRAKGIPVALTVLIDSPAPGAMPGKTTDFAEILDYLLGDELEFDVDELRELEPEEQLNYVFEEARHVNRVDILPPSLGIPMFKTWMAHQDALHSYTPKSYQGRVIYFRPTELAKLNALNMHLPWIDLVKGGIEIHQVPGNHITMNYEPNVKVIAKHLKRALRSLRK